MCILMMLSITCIDSVQEFCNAFKQLTCRKYHIILNQVITQYSNSENVLWYNRNIFMTMCSHLPHKSEFFLFLYKYSVRYRREIIS